MMGRLVFLYTLLMGCFFIVQGYSILRTGNVRGVLARFDREASTAIRPTPAMRVLCALVYAGAGLALLIVLCVAAAKQHVTASLALWRLGGLSTDLVWPLLLASSGLYTALWPRAMLKRTVKRLHPETDENDPRAVLLVRVLGEGIFAVALVMILTSIS